MMSRNLRAQSLLGRRRGFGAFDGLRQPVGGLDLVHFLVAAVGLGDEIKRVAHQSFGDVARTFEETADLLIDSRADLLDCFFFRQSVLGQRREVGRGDPPESAGGRDFLRRLDALDGVAHLGDAAAILWGEQPGQQAALEADAFLADTLPEFRRGKFFGAAGAPRRAYAKIGKEQIGRSIALDATRFLHFAVKRKESQRLIRLAVDQVVEIVGDRRQRAVCEFDGRFAGRTRLLLDGFEQRLQGLSELRDAVESDDGQRALGLVQVGAAKLDLGQVADAFGDAGGIKFQRLVRAFQGKIDLALDPGQRANIKISRGVHLDGVSNFSAGALPPWRAGIRHEPFHQCRSRRAGSGSLVRRHADGG